MLHHWMHRYGDEHSVPIMLWGVCQFSEGTELVSWKLQSINYADNLQFSPCHPRMSLSSRVKQYTLRVSHLTHIHTLVLPAQRSPITWCQFRYLRPTVPSIIFRLRFTLYCFCPFLCLFQPWYFRMQPQTLGQKGRWWWDFTITVQCQIIRDLPYWGYSGGEIGCKRCSPGHLRNCYMFSKSTYFSLGETWPSPLFSQMSMLFVLDFSKWSSACYTFVLEHTIPSVSWLSTFLSLLHNFYIA